MLSHCFQPLLIRCVYLVGLSQAGLGTYDYIIKPTLTIVIVIEQKLIYEFLTTRSEKT